MRTKSMRARKVTNTDYQTDYTENRANNQNGELCNCIGVLRYSVREHWPCYCSKFHRSFMFNADPRATGKKKEMLYTKTRGKIDTKKPR